VSAYGNLETKEKFKLFPLKVAMAAYGMALYGNAKMQFVWEFKWGFVKAVISEAVQKHLLIKRVLSVIIRILLIIGFLVERCQRCLLPVHLYDLNFSRYSLNHTGSLATKTYMYDIFSQFSA